MSVFYVLFAYACLAVAIVFLSIKLSDYIDLLDKKTNISGAFLGGVLLAAVTSLPEMFTSVSAVLFLNETGMVIGNILGSNLFDILILGVCILLFYKSYKKSNLFTESHLSVSVGLGGMYLTMLLALFLGETYQLKIGSFNLCFLAIAVIYGFTIYKLPKNDEDEVKSDIQLKGMELSLKQIIVRFVICSVLLVAASIVITLVTDDLAEMFNLSASTAGVLFLAIATSLPEVVSTIALCKKGNFDAGFGNILGSCLFNVFVLFLAELLSFKTSILVPFDFDSLKLVVLNLLSLTIAVLTIILKSKKRTSTATLYSERIFAILMVLLYILYYIV
jgi:cation:H+ antiporter